MTRRKPINTKIITFWAKDILPMSVALIFFKNLGYIFRALGLVFLYTDKKYKNL